MKLIIATLAVSFVIAFIIWQFKVMMKYTFNFDNMSIDEKNKLITLNKEKIFFKDIDHIEINELEQPKLYEKLLSKGAAYNYISEINIYLKNGNQKKCTFNYKVHLYKTLKQLQQYITINSDIEIYKQKGLPDWLVLILLILGCVLIIILLQVNYLHYLQVVFVRLKVTPLLLHLPLALALM